MRDLQLNLRSFHQTKTLCLLALIFNHCLSFSTQQGQTAVSTLKYQPLFLLIPLLNGLFVTMTGVTYRLSLEDHINGDRLYGGLQTVLDLLLLLIGIDFVKNHFLYHGQSPLIEWDFLKTILVSFLICYALSRIHIYLCFLFAGLVSWFYLDIQNFLFRLAWVPSTDWTPPVGFSAFHFVNGAIVSLLAAYLAFKIWRRALPTRLKTLLSGGLLWILLALLTSIAQTEPSFTEIRLAHNWWIDGLIGGAGYSVLMPVFVWGLGLPAGFALTHFFIRHPQTVEKLNPVWIAILAALVFLPLWAFMNYTTPLLQTETNSLWGVAGENETSFWVEVMHAAALILVFSSFWLFNRTRESGWLEQICTKLSLASFWVYILATSLTRVLTEQVHMLTGSTWATALIAFYLTLALAWALAEALFLLSKKQLRFTLTRAEGVA